jgi:hypothetical protein
MLKTKYNATPELLINFASNQERLFSLFFLRIQLRPITAAIDFTGAPKSQHDARMWRPTPESCVWWTVGRGARTSFFCAFASTSAAYFPTSGVLCTQVPLGSSIALFRFWFSYFRIQIRTSLIY